MGCIVAAEERHHHKDVAASSFGLRRQIAAK